MFKKKTITLESREIIHISSDFLNLTVYNYVIYIDLLFNLFKHSKN